MWRHVTEQEADASTGLGEDAGADTPRSELDLDDTAGNADAVSAGSVEDSTAGLFQTAWICFLKILLGGGDPAF